MFAKVIISKTFQDFSSIFFLFCKIDSLFVILKAELICNFSIQGMFSITISDFRVFILGGQCGCTQLNRHNLFCSQDRYVLIDVVVSPEWMKKWLILLMHAQCFICLPRPSLLCCNLVCLERVNWLYHPKPGAVGKGQSVPPTPTGSDMPVEALCVCKTCSFDITPPCRVNSPVAAKKLRNPINRHAISRLVKDEIFFCKLTC